MTNGSHEPEMEDEQVCCEALEVMTLCIALIPTALDILNKEIAWQTFIIDLLLQCPSNYAYNSNINVPNADVLLNNEIDWLKRIRDNVKNMGETFVEEPILEGHLGVTKELLAFQTPEKKYHVGCEKGGAYLVRELIDDFIFPASKAYLQYMKNGELPATLAVPVCSSPATISAGFELLVALAIGCVQNLKQIVDCLTEMYYTGTAVTTFEGLTEWEYLPPVAPRPPKGFVGLKNAGATCYMNSVIQQLYMIPSIRNSILAVEGTGSDIDENMFEDEKQDGNPPLPNPFGDPNLSQPIMPVQQNVADILFVNTSYVKKVIEDSSNSKETIKLLRFCCWENPQFSSTVLSELLWQVKEK
ncbi:Putative ubiquitin carboxyl-terminal hydrolase FAF-Y [Fukomys damarensis]|uniref:Putative ubiquitin carboxyl-terminal hydrolase FAF-Y n=1 Tax=Fukomys damarensis TaxID=885580 RepID=A0A091CVC8_FUKDA|nr:Putative ubiquitin carboxyl-terminal hydrolase FAF-Y [Fukomys damarensis]